MPGHSFVQRKRDDFIERSLFQCVRVCAEPTRIPAAQRAGLVVRGGLRRRHELWNGMHSVRVTRQGAKERRQFGIDLFTCIAVAREQFFFALCVEAWIGAQVLEECGEEFIRWLHRSCWICRKPVGSANHRKHLRTNARYFGNASLMNGLGIHVGGGMHTQRVVVPSRAVGKIRSADGIATRGQIRIGDPVASQTNLQQDGQERRVQFLAQGSLLGGRNRIRKLCEGNAQGFQIAFDDGIKLRGQTFHGHLCRHAPLSHAKLHEFLRINDHLRNGTESLDVILTVCCGAERHAISHLRNVLLRPVTTTNRHEERTETVTVLRLTHLPGDELPSQEVITAELCGVNLHELSQEYAFLRMSLLDSNNGCVGDAIGTWSESTVGDGILGPLSVAPALHLVDEGEPTVARGRRR